MGRQVVSRQVVGNGQALDSRLELSSRSWMAANVGTHAVAFPLGKNQSMLTSPSSRLFPSSFAPLSVRSHKTALGRPIKLLIHRRLRLVHCVDPFGFDSLIAAALTVPGTIGGRVLS